MANNVSYVTQGKPKVGGAVFRAVLDDNLTIPTDATTALSADFVNMGYISEDGLSNANSPESDEIKAWGGDVVLNPQTSKADTWTFTMIEAINPEVLKAVYGSSNVTGDLSTGLTVKANSDEQEEACWVFEQVLRGGVILRTVIPDGKITDIGDVSYVDNEAVGYEVTVSGMPDSTGQTHYKYMKSA